MKKLLISGLVIFIFVIVYIAYRGVYESGKTNNAQGDQDIGLSESGITYYVRGTELYMKDNKIYFGYQGVRECDIEVTEIADPSSFKILTGSIYNGGYAKDSINNYEFGQICILLIGAKCGCRFSINTTTRDVDSFIELDDHYSKDSKNVYIWDTIIPGADPTTFEIIDGSPLHLGKTYPLLSKDKSHVFFNTGIIIGADPTTFEIIPGETYPLLSKDKYHVFSNTGIIIGADPSTIEIVDQGNLSFHFRRDFLKDKKFVYYMGNSNNIRTLTGADPSTFRIYNSYYSGDKNKIFIYGQEIVGVDVATFEIIPGEIYPLLSKDKYHVFSNTGIIIGADSSTFRTYNKYYSGDKNKIFFYGQEIVGVDVATFEIIPVTGNDPTILAKDKNNVYHERWIVPGADPATFTYSKLTGKGKDKNQEYYF